MQIKQQQQQQQHPNRFYSTCSTVTNMNDITSTRDIPPSNESIKANDQNCNLPMKEAIQKYCLRPADFKGLPFQLGENPSSSSKSRPIMKYYASIDCYNAALKKHGSLSKLEEARLAWKSVKKSPDAPSPAGSVLEALISTPPSTSQVQKKRGKKISKSVSKAVSRKLVLSKSAIMSSEIKGASKTSSISSDDGTQSYHDTCILSLKNEKRKHTLVNNTDKRTRQSKQIPKQKITSIEKKASTSYCNTNNLKSKEQVNVVHAKDSHKQEKNNRVELGNGLNKKSNSSKSYLKSINSDKSRKRSREQLTSTESDQFEPKSLLKRDNLLSDANIDGKEIKSEKEICTCSWTEVTAAYHVLIDETRSYISSHKYSHRPLSFGEKLILQKQLDNLSDKVRIVSHDLLLNKRLANKAKEASGHCEKLRSILLETRAFVLTAEQESQKLEEEVIQLKRKVECGQRATEVLDLFRELSNH